MPETPQVESTLKFFNLPDELIYAIASERLTARDIYYCLIATRNPKTPEIRAAHIEFLKSLCVTVDETSIKYQMKLVTLAPYLLAEDPKLFVKLFLNNALLMKGMKRDLYQGMNSIFSFPEHRLSMLYVMNALENKKMVLCRERIKPKDIMQQCFQGRGKSRDCLSVFFRFFTPDELDKFCGEIYNIFQYFTFEYNDLRKRLSLTKDEVVNAMNVFVLLSPFIKTQEWLDQLLTAILNIIQNQECEQEIRIVALDTFKKTFRYLHDKNMIVQFIDRADSMYEEVHIRSQIVMIIMPSVLDDELEAMLSTLMHNCIKTPSPAFLKFIKGMIQTLSTRPFFQEKLFSSGFLGFVIDQFSVRGYVYNSELRRDTVEILEALIPSMTSDYLKNSSLIEDLKKLVKNYRSTISLVSRLFEALIPLLSDEARGTLFTDIFSDEQEDFHCLESLGDKIASYFSASDVQSRFDSLLQKMQEGFHDHFRRQLEILVPYINTTTREKLLNDLPVLITQPADFVFFCGEIRVYLTQKFFDENNFVEKLLSIYDNDDDPDKVVGFAVLDILIFCYKCYASKNPAQFIGVMQRVISFCASQDAWRLLNDLILYLPLDCVLSIIQKYPLLDILREELTPADRFPVDSLTWSFIKTLIRRGVFKEEGAAWITQFVSMLYNAVLRSNDCKEEWLDILTLLIVQGVNLHADLERDKENQSSKIEWMILDQMQCAYDVNEKNVPVKQPISTSTAESGWSGAPHCNLMFDTSSNFFSCEGSNAEGAPSFGRRSVRPAFAGMVQTWRKPGS